MLVFIQYIHYISHVFSSLSISLLFLLSTQCTCIYITNSYEQQTSSIIKTSTSYSPINLLLTPFSWSAFTLLRYFSFTPITFERSLNRDVRQSILGYKKKKYKKSSGQIERTIIGIPLPFPSSSDNSSTSPPSSSSSSDPPIDIIEKKEEIKATEGKEVSVVEESPPPPPPLNRDYMPFLLQHFNLQSTSTFRVGTCGQPFHDKFLKNIFDELFRDSGVQVVVVDVEKGWANRRSEYDIIVFGPFGIPPNTNDDLSQKLRIWLTGRERERDNDVGC